MEQPFAFAPEIPAAPPATLAPGRVNPRSWKLLIVDDDLEVHDVTRLALANIEFEGAPVQFLHAYSAAEAMGLLELHTDVALALVDVVMETEHAGLDLVRHIREVLKNSLVRIVLRTGQPGQAPERAVIRDYDINDYKEKTELSAQKLFSTVYASLRSHRDLLALEANRRGLERVVAASGELLRVQAVTGFIQGVLEQMVALLRLDQDSVFLTCDTLALEADECSMKVLAATGRFADAVGRDARESIDPATLALIKASMEGNRPLTADGAFVGTFSAGHGRDGIIFVSSGRPIHENDARLIDLFRQNASIAYQNLLLRDDLEGTQRDMVLMLGDAIETRSRETGQHVRRVAEYCRLLAQLIGLPEREANILCMAAPLHDFGKICVPDHILNKPGKLDGEEYSIMRDHAIMGESFLVKSEREILKAAAIIAGQHHEKWDGTGYPRGFKGEEIHIYGRIGALADVFDALGTRRCYKEPWGLDAITDFICKQSGTQFDPRLVDCLIANLSDFAAVRENFPD